MRNWVIFGLIAGFVYYGTKAMGALMVSDKSIIKTLNPRIHKVDSNGIIIRTEIAVDNPTKQSIRINKPIVTLTSNGVYLANSLPEQRSFLIAPLSRTLLETSEIQIPWMSISGLVTGILSKVPEMIAKHQTEGKLDFSILSFPLEYFYTTYVDGIYHQSKPERIL